MPLSHDRIRTTVETCLARHPHGREQPGALFEALGRTGDDSTSRSTSPGEPRSSVLT